MSGPANDLLSAALNYAQQGWPVFPIHSVQDGHCSCGRTNCSSVGKHPRTKQGFKDATIDEAQIQRWWSEWPDANVGIVTGAKSGLVVLDIDPRNGGEASLADLERQQGTLPKTVLSLTGGGGQHVFFRHPGGSVKSKPIAEGVDVKADGGYVVAPPSTHRSGERYRWHSSRHPDDLALAALPSWLDAQLTKRREHVSQPSVRTPTGKIQQGQRNERLMSMAGAMRRHGAEETTILQALKAHNHQHCESALSEQEVEQIARSISKYPAEAGANSAETLNQSGEDNKPGKVSCADN